MNVTELQILELIVYNVAQRWQHHTHDIWLGFFLFSDCGIAQAKPQSRIIGGNDAMYGEFPWQVWNIGANLLNGYQYFMKY